MSDDSREADAEIIRAAYAEKVREAFHAFADNIGMGQNEKQSAERFLRTLELVRKARELALEAATKSGEALAARADSTVSPHRADDAPLSPEDQALIEQALAGTTGQRTGPISTGALNQRPLPRR